MQSDHILAVFLHLIEAPPKQEDNIHDHAGLCFLFLTSVVYVYMQF